MYAPRGGCLFHDWDLVHSTGRHDYEQCTRCQARRIVDVDAHAPTSETVDVDWACRHHQELPATDRLAAFG